MATYPDGVRTKPTPPSAGESYFATCERDEGGHCLPAGGGGGGAAQEVDLSYEDAEQKQQAEVAAQEFFGAGGTPHDFAAAVGAEPGAKVSIQVASAREVRIRVDHPLYTSARELLADMGGEKWISNEEFYLRSTTPRGTGVGERVFARQVENAVALGFSRIETFGTGPEDGGDANGYYTWPRFGYDAALSKAEAAELAPPYDKAERLSDIFATPEGREYWKGNGYGKFLTFDLTDGSLSRRVLDAYRKQRAERKQRGE